MRRIFLGAILAPLFLSIAFAKDAKLEKVYKAFDRVEVLPAIKEKPVSERLHILCGALAVYKEAQGEDFESKKLEADVAFYSARKHNYSACREITKEGRYPWVHKSLVYIKPKNKKSWLESQKAALYEKENPKPVEYVCNRNVYHPSKKKMVYKMTKKLVFYNYIDV